MVKRRERRRVLGDPRLKPVQSLVHVNVLRVLVDGLDARIFAPRSIGRRLNSNHIHVLKCGAGGRVGDGR